MRVRPAGPDDIATLTALDPIAAQSVDRVRSIQEWVGADWCFCVVTDEEIAGYGVVHRHFFGRFFLEMLMVGEAFRRKGIGRALLRHALSRSPGDCLWTSTNRSNLAMQGLLAELGFAQMGSIEGLDDDDPELIFRGPAR